MKVLLAHPQTQHSYKIANILYENSILTKFFTTYTINKEVAQLFPKYLQNLVVNRINTLPTNRINSNLFLEINRAIRHKVLRLELIPNFYKINTLFQEQVKETYLKEADVIIGFDTSSWILSQKAKSFNKSFILDRTIGHPYIQKKIYKKFSEIYPDWANEFKWNLGDKYINFENIEQENADYITVGGKFVKDGLLSLGVPENKIYINPYGIDMDFFKSKEKLKDSKLTFLFFGTICARKGIPTLLRAWERVSNSNCQLLLAGNGYIPQNVVLPDNVKVLGVINPYDRDELYNSAHVFVFPSLFEGFGQVIIEAAACGLPIITTFNTGGVELVEDGLNGFLTEAGDEDSLAERIKFFIDNPEKILDMGLSRVEYIRNYFSLSSYGERWIKLLDKT